MKKNIFKKFVVISFIFVSLFINNVFAEDIALDITAPVIELIGESNISINVGGVYTDMGAEAVDDIDGSVPVITQGIEYIDTSKVGFYEITYTAVDSVGNTSTINRTLNVISVPLLNSISVVTEGVKLSYNVGDSLDISGLVVTGLYSDGSIKNEIITTDDITGFDSSTPVADQVLTINVEGKTATYLININAIQTKNINLKIYAGDTILFNGHKDVVACAESIEINAPITFNGKCAIEQTNLSNTWTWDYSPSGWLDELGGYSTTPDYSKFWNWFSNLNYGDRGLNQHLLVDGEELLLTYNSFPLKISTSKISGVVGDTIDFIAEEKSSFDANYNMIWTASKEVTINLGNQSCSTSIDGKCSIVLNTSGSLRAIGSKTLYVPSNEISIEVQSLSSGGGGGEDITNFSIENALNFLLANQENDGSFGNSLYTDWMSIGIASVDGVSSNFKNTIFNYLKNEEFQSNVVTDNERHAMALMALGINPYTGTNIDYIQKITSSFDGIQLGDSSLYNDDIFGLIVLSHVGYKKNDEIIKSVASHVISKQDDNGSWGSVDMTAAGIQALSNFKNLNGVEDSIANGELYLKSKQAEDGGFENSFSTSWAIQALSQNNSYDEEVDNGIKYLVGIQHSDGGLNIGSSVSNRIWATAYALPAILKLSWNEILENFDKEEEIDEVLQYEAKEELPEQPKIESPILLEAEVEIIEKPIILNKIEKTFENKEKTEPLVEEEIDNDLLLASALGSINDEELSSSLINRILNIIKIPFVWLWIVLGF